MAGVEYFTGFSAGFAVEVDAVKFNVEMDKLVVHWFAAVRTLPEEIDWDLCTGSCFSDVGM